MLFLVIYENGIILKRFAEFSQFNLFMAMNDKYVTRKTLLLRARDPEDHDAWGEFVEFYKRFIYHVLNRMNISDNDFDDLVQEVLIRLWEKLGTYDPEKARFRSWLSFVIRNIVINHVRQKSRRSQQMENLADTLTDSASGSEIEQMIEKEWKLYISKMAFDTVKELFSGKAIQVFELSLEGFDTAQISVKVGIAQGSVKVLKSRVKSRYMAEVQRLITELEEC